VAGRRFEITSDRTATADIIEWLVEPLRLELRPGSSHTVEQLSSVWVDADPERIELLPLQLNRLVGADDRHLVLHAGGVVLDGNVIVIIGASGAGKSTLTAALVQLGARYLSDEAVLIGLDDGHLCDYSKRLSLDRHSRELLGLSGDGDGSEDDALLSPTQQVRRENDHVEWRAAQVHPRRLHPDAVDVIDIPGSVALIVMPIVAMGRQGSSPSIDPRVRWLEPHHVGLSLARSCYNLDVVGLRGMERITQLARVPMAEVSCSDPLSTARFVQSLLG
jgi:hypothetical protein